MRKTRNLAALGALLVIASLPGLLNVLAKDHVSTAEGVIAWVSLVALMVGVLALVTLAAIRLRRFANPS